MCFVKHVGCKQMEVKEGKSDVERACFLVFGKRFSMEFSVIFV